MRLFSTVSFLVGLTLFGLNLYGLTKSLRPEGLNPEVLRFSQNDLTLSKNEFFSDSLRLNSESDYEYATRLTYVISNGMAHVHWERFEPSVFHQTVPVWENFILFLMGKYSGIPEFERYHFTIPEKSIERGVGLCGDASMLLSELLNREEIENSIITIPGHVMVQVTIDGKKTLLDPDFGVVLQQDVESYLADPNLLETEYNLSGFKGNGEKVVSKGIQSGKVEFWAGTKHFVTKKYYFERVSYFLIWLIPIFLLLLPLFIKIRQKRKHEGLIK
ncbi:hypothetical protein [Alteromonas portus]|uniref:hypothetical protein n=1 Tax=Alteromonas portus TaxID=2565549 RepID=UPI003BF77881